MAENKGDSEVEIIEYLKIDIERKRYMESRYCLYGKLAKIQKIVVVLLLLIMVMTAQGVIVNARNIITGINKEDTISPIRYNVVLASKKIQLNKKNLNLLVYSTYQLKISNKKTTTKVKWSSANKKIAKVSENGVVTAKKDGTTKITAKVSNKKFVCKVTVKQPNTSNKEARKKFKEYLSQPKIPWVNNDKSEVNVSKNFKFICLDMGKNKVPVMILDNKMADHASGWTGVYQYINGKVKEVGRKDYIQEIEPERGIITIGYYHGHWTSTWYYNFKSKKNIANNVAYTSVSFLDDQDFRSLYGDNIYQIGKKDVTKKKFDAYYKKIVKNSSKIKRENVDKWLLDNTESNREKYFK